eukprot:CAMPEP_0203802978 /NCGR_PEP_ID=MMETSP0100_2-20121128/12497_1 /ASSEMBLY_ACC=CAM_ASM_000210 /TAXON_ID=96639 /ORGANISM=" , Strain NY0313808BC1" /LENGTH=403 /DNA_ID=CAMNT_0050710481 /DNA_START=27 /DNA_END=1236 /DNA_ORIENTATION=-
MKTRFLASPQDLRDDDSGKRRRKGMYLPSWVTRGSAQGNHRGKRWPVLFVVAMVTMVCMLVLREGKDQVKIVRSAGITPEIEGSDHGKPEFMREIYRNPDIAEEQAMEKGQLFGDTNDMESVVEAETGAEERSQQNIFETLENVQFPDLTKLPDNILYSNYEEYEAAPWVKVPNQAPLRRQWWGLQDFPCVKSQCPTQPRHFSGEIPQAWPARQVPLRQPEGNGVPNEVPHVGRAPQKVPIYRAMNGRTFSQYRPNAQYAQKQIDLGPGLAAIADDGALVRKNGLRNFPRNMQVKVETLSALDIQWPPLVAPRFRQRPAFWMGTSSSGTGFHHDCCDNFVMMISGTKRFTLAPTTDWYSLKPKCVGKHRSLCYANPAEPNKPGVDTSFFHKMVVDIEPGEILY